MHNEHACHVTQLFSIYGETKLYLISKVKTVKDTGQFNNIIVEYICY